MVEFLRKLIGFFDRFNIPYMLSGSMAMTTYTLDRYTKDFDFVVHLKPSDVPHLISYFNEGFYYDEDSVKEAIRLKGMFNIIDHNSHYKSDFFILSDDEFERTKFERRKLISFLDFKIFVISLEDLILSKFIWIQKIQSALQTNDIIRLSQLDDIDWKYIWYWIDRLKLNTFELLQK